MTQISICEVDHGLEWGCGGGGDDLVKLAKVKQSGQ